MPAFEGDQPAAVGRMAQGLGIAVVLAFQRLAMGIAQRAIVGRHHMLRQPGGIGGEFHVQPVTGIRQSPEAAAVVIYSQAGIAAEAAVVAGDDQAAEIVEPRSEEHTSELQKLMAISYAFFSW